MTDLPDRVTAALLARSTKHRWLEAKVEAFHIWGTIGLDVLLKTDGSLLRYDWEDGDEENGTLSRIDDAPTRWVALRVARRQIPELEALLPQRGGVVCSECVDLVDGNGIFTICQKCKGTGFVG